MGYIERILQAALDGLRPSTETKLAALDADLDAIRNVDVPTEHG